MAAAVASPTLINSGLDGSSNGMSAATQAANAVPSGSTNTNAKPALAKQSGSKMKLTSELISSFKPARLFHEETAENESFTSVSFDDSGVFSVVATDAYQIRLYDCRSGKFRKHFYSKKYGVQLVRFTHNSSNIIHTATQDNVIRYQALPQNDYLRYFKGHKKKVVSLEMSPADDTFLSGSKDDTVRLWDVRTDSCQGMLKVAGAPSVAYDPSGMVFAVGLNFQPTVLLYDIRKLDSEPFAEIPITDPILQRSGIRPLENTSIKCSNDGQHILVSTSGNVHYVLHSFDYKVIARLEGHEGLEGAGQDGDRSGISGEETSWTPDGRFVISGSLNGRICIWDVNPPEDDLEARKDRPPASPECTLRPIKILEGHKSPSRILRFNPRYSMFVSGATKELAFWLADISELAESSKAQAA